MWFEQMPRDMIRRAARAHVGGAVVPIYGFRLRVELLGERKVTHVELGDTIEAAKNWLIDRYGQSDMQVLRLPSTGIYLYTVHHLVFTSNDTLAFEFRMRWC